MHILCGFLSRPLARSVKDGFDRLAATVDAIPQDVFLAFSEPGPDVTDGLVDVERWTEMLREVGINRLMHCNKAMCNTLNRDDDPDRVSAVHVTVDFHA